MVPCEEVVNVGPVRYKQAVPSKLILHPAAQKHCVGVGGDAVDRGRIHHGGEGACAEALQERGEELLPEVVFGNDGRGAVLAGYRNAVAHKVLYGNGNVFKVNVIGVFALKGKSLLAGHFGLEVRILAEAFPNAGPAGIAAEVHYRGEHPRNTRRTGLISHGMAHLTGKLTVESCAKVNLLGIQGAFRKIGCAVYHIKAVDAGDAYCLHGFFLDLTHHLCGFGPGVSLVMHHIEDGAHLVFTYDLVKFGGVKGLAGFVLKDGDVKLHKLAGLLFKAHSGKDFLYLCLYGFVLRNRPLGLGRAAGYNAKSCAQHNQQSFHITGFNIVKALFPHPWFHRTPRRPRLRHPDPRQKDGTPSTPLS